MLRKELKSNDLIVPPYAKASRDQKKKKNLILNIKCAKISSENRIKDEAASRSCRVNYGFCGNKPGS